MKLHDRKQPTNQLTNQPTNKQIKPQLTLHIQREVNREDHYSIRQSTNHEITRWYTGQTLCSYVTSYWRELETMELKELERLDLERKNSWQHVKHAQL